MSSRNRDRLQCVAVGLQFGRAGLEPVGVDEGDRVDILVVGERARLALGHCGRDAGEQHAPIESEIKPDGKASSSPESSDAINMPGIMPSYGVNTTRGAHFVRFPLFL